MHKSKTLISQTKAGLCIILLLFSLLLGAIHVRTAAGDNQSPKVPILAADRVDHRYNTSGSSEFWHDGVDTNTPEVDIYYYTLFQAATPSIPEAMVGNMRLCYKDGSDVNMEMLIMYSFRDGGLDVANKKVLNWSKFIGCGAMMHTDETVNHTAVQTVYEFRGFQIRNGSATGPSSNLTNESLLLGSIEYRNIDYGNGSHHNGSAKISKVELSTKDYTSNGTVLKESIANFSMVVNAAFSKWPLIPADAIDVPVVMKFQITHNITQTTYKYGLNLNWSAIKNFPTILPISTGSNYSILAEDHLGL